MWKGIYTQAISQQDEGSYIAAMRFLAILVLAIARCMAQRITLGSVFLDLDTCASPQGTYQCYQQAGNTETQAS